MKITITRKNHRNQLVCERDDGSRTIANLGPSLPYHDLAHYVAERTFGLTGGFFAGIAAGHTISELSDADVIRTLGPESWQAEVLARGLGSLVTGACKPDQFDALVNSELRHMGVETISGLNHGVAESLLQQYQDLIESYRRLGEGDSIELQFDETTGSAPA